jgi:PKD repeat protein
MKKSTLLRLSLLLGAAIGITGMLLTCNSYKDPLTPDNLRAELIAVTPEDSRLAGDTLLVRFTINLPTLVASATVSFGDDSSTTVTGASFDENGIVEIRHIYALPGNYTISNTIHLTDVSVKSAPDLPITIKGKAPVIAHTNDTMRTVSEGGQATLSFVVTGTQPLTWLWKHGNDSVGKTAQLAISNAKPVDSGSYTCMVSNTWGTATSQTIHLSVAEAADSAPKITLPPASISVALGNSATFSVTATGKPAPTFQWKKNGDTIQGATSSTYMIPSVTMADTGSYTVVITNSQGSITSQAVVLTISGYALTVTATNGSVTKTPDKPLYDSGTTVGLKPRRLPDITL